MTDTACSRAAKHLEMVADEFDAAKDALPERVRADRDAIREVLHDLETYRDLVASLQAHQYDLLGKIARLETERDDWRGLASDKAVALNHCKAWLAALLDAVEVASPLALATHDGLAKAFAEGRTALTRAKERGEP